MHNRLLLEELVLNSFFIEFKDEETEYNNSVEFTRASKDDTGEALSAVVTRKSIHYLSDPVEMDSRFIIPGISRGQH